MSRYESAKEHILNKLTSELSPKLYYHSVAHVLDVLDAATMIGLQEQISETEMEYLKIAALYHDTGFIVSDKNHEKLSCDFAHEFLNDFRYSANEIHIITDVIMATRVPQRPQNHLQQIMCDADLDYLGRDDFYPIAHKIFLEMRDRGAVKNENDWNHLQVGFLTAHNYFTKTSIHLRKVKKEKHLEEVKLLLCPV